MHCVLCLSRQSVRDCEKRASHLTSHYTLLYTAVHLFFRDFLQATRLFCAPTCTLICFSFVSFICFSFAPHEHSSVLNPMCCNQVTRSTTCFALHLYTWPRLFESWIALSTRYITTIPANSHALGVSLTPAG